MEKIVKSCGECPFMQYFNDYGHTCQYYYEDPFTDTIWIDNVNIIHPNCPEKGPFIIKTQKIEDDKS